MLLKGINPIVKFLILSDILVVSSNGMIGPFFALLVSDFIVGANALVVSIAIGAYLISRSIIQIPIAQLIDKIKGEKDDFYLMIIFSLISSLIPLFYLLIKTPLHLYLVQIVLGITTAITYPSYMAIFTRHIDKHKEGTEWGIYYTLTDVGSAGFAILAGYLVEYHGFINLILSVVIIGVIGSLFLAPIKYYLTKK